MKPYLGSERLIGGVAVALLLSLAAPVEAAPPTALTVFQLIGVGKWPEGVVAVGDRTWVAVSGERKVTRLRLAAGEAVDQPVGRLPVELVAGDEGTVYGLIVTDGKVLRLAPKPAPVLTLPDYGESLIWMGGRLWILLWEQGSSLDSSVIRFDPTTRQQARSPKLGRDAFDLAGRDGHLWVAHGDGRLTLLDAELQVVRVLAVGGRPMRLAAGPDAVYAGDERGVLRVGLTGDQVTHRAELGERVAALLWTAQAVIAAGESGDFTYLDPATLAVQARLASPVGRVAIQSLAVSGELLLATTHENRTGGKPERGTLMVLRPR